MKTIGLDIGTTSISCVVMDFADKKQLASVTVPNDTYMNVPPWRREQAPEEIFSLCEKTLSELLLRFPDVSGIGITGQMHGMLYLDAAGRAVSPLYTWEDERGNLPYAGGRSYAEHLTKLAGCKMATGFGLTTHYYNSKKRLVPAEAAKMCTIMDYTAMRLCGLSVPVMHSSNAASWGAYDIENACFDTAALSRAELDPSLLPPVLSGEPIVGHTAQGIPVVVPIGDNQSGIYGVAEQDGDIVLNIGTSSQISAVCDFCEPPAELELRPYVGGRCIMLGAGLCGGSSFALLNSLFREICDLSGTELSKDAMYELMLTAAQRAEKSKSERLYVSPLFRGTRQNSRLRGSIEGISTANFTVGDLVLGFFYGVCEEMCRAYSKMPLNRSDGRLLLSGNALRKNEILRRVCSEVFGRNTYLPEFSEEAAVGAAKLACKRLT